MQERNINAAQSTNLLTLNFTAMKIKTKIGGFHDEDMPEGNKVYWYFKEKIFG